MVDRRGEGVSQSLLNTTMPIARGFARMRNCYYDSLVVHVGGDDDVGESPQRELADVVVRGKSKDRCATFGKQSGLSDTSLHLLIEQPAMTGTFVLEEFYSGLELVQRGRVKTEEHYC